MSMPKAAGSSSTQISQGSTQVSQVSQASQVSQGSQGSQAPMGSKPKGTAGTSKTKGGRPPQDDAGKMRMDKSRDRDVDELPGTLPQDDDDNLEAFAETDDGALDGGSTRDTSPNRSYKGAVSSKAAAPGKGTEKAQSMSKSEKAQAFKDRMAKYRETNKDWRKDQGHSSTKTQKAGLIFPVGRVARMMKKARWAPRFSSTAPIMMAAALEYIASEVITAGVENAVRNQRGAKKNSMLLPQHIRGGIVEDEEFSSILSNVTICRGGYKPHTDIGVFVGNYTTSHKAQVLGKKKRTPASSKSRDGEEDDMDDEEASQGNEPEADNGEYMD